MKKLLIVVGVLCLALLGASYWFGVQAEGLMQASLERMTASNPMLKISLKNKSRGLFSSTYTYTLDNAPPGDSAKDSRVVMDLTTRVAHGPIPVAAGIFAPCLGVADATFAVDPNSSADIREFFDKFPELLRSTMRTRFAFDGSGRTDLAVPAFQKSVPGEDGEPVALDWQGMNVKTDFTSDFGSYTAVANAPLLRIRSNKSDVTLTGFEGRYDMKRSDHNIWTGTQRSTLASVTNVPAGNVPPTRIDRVALNLDITPKADLLDYAVEANGVFTPTGKPPLPLSLKAGLRDLEQASLSELYDLLRTPAPAPGGAALESPAGRRLIQALLARSPSLALALEVKEGGAPLALNLEVRCQDMKALPEEWLQAITGLRAQAGFEGGAKATADLACRFQEQTGAAPEEGGNCAEGMLAQLDQFAEQGFVVKDGDKLTAKAVWDGKALTVNGNRMF